MSARHHHTLRCLRSLGGRMTCALASPARARKRFGRTSAGTLLIEPPRSLIAAVSAGRDPLAEAMRAIGHMRLRNEHDNAEASQIYRHAAVSEQHKRGRTPRYEALLTLADHLWR